jgi:hypothetical protein
MHTEDRHLFIFLLSVYNKLSSAAVAAAAASAAVAG